MRAARLHPRAPSALLQPGAPLRFPAAAIASSTAVTAVLERRLTRPAANQKPGQGLGRGLRAGLEWRSPGRGGVEISEAWPSAAEEASALPPGLLPAHPGRSTCSDPAPSAGCAPKPANLEADGQRDRWPLPAKEQTCSVHARERETAIQRHLPAPGGLCHYVGQTS
ncbi:hypothetical protein NN561_006717 [Cricetulus griseus]